MRGNIMEIRAMVIEDYERVYKLWTNTAGMGMRSLDDSQRGIEKFLTERVEFSHLLQGGDG